MNIHQPHAPFRRSLFTFPRRSLTLSPPPSLSLPLVLSVCLCLAATRDASAQIRRLRRPPAIIYSNLLYAEAQALTQFGVARIVNAKAASMEMDNAVKWVNTYFKRRQLNRKYRAAEHTSYLEHAEKRKETYHRIIDKNLVPPNSDLSNELNLMLREILAHSSYADFMSDTPNSMISSEHNAELDKRERHEIQLTEGKLAGGRSMKFRADKAEVLETDRWPMALRDDRFNEARKKFEEARDWAVAELKNDEHQVSNRGADKLMAAVDGLTSKLSEVYPRERLRTISPRDFHDFDTAKHFIQSLVGSTLRLIETNSAVAFDESYRFQGKTVAELLQHMLTRGLEFAPAEPGGEGVYRKLYQSVRGFYKEIVPDPNKFAGR